ncbi:WASH complex subunit 2-like [Heterocephalus glaber]|uniref:WASH complex subunit 2-like n=1 Tax=Heterocephalus glaber TaxID=10181 RepID=A0AAX6SH75_HETGA|nr:WASH complex subunit 2-like [Heterocephalus glaber]
MVSSFPMQMNQTTPDLERAPASEAEWERPWSVEEIRRSSQNWSLAADAGLLQFLQEFSQQTISRTHEIKKQVDGLIRETKRVYDEELEEPVLKVEAEKTEQEKTREQKEVDLIPKVQEAVNYGLQVLDNSEEDDINERVELILEPKDLYIDRPLPYLIGSKLFMEQEDVGLGELSSKEGSVGSDRGSIVDSDAEKEEEESENDFANQSDNDQNQHTTQMSNEEEDDDADLFADSEEEDIEDVDKDTKPKKPMSFADELAAQIKGDGSRLGEEQAGELGQGNKSSVQYRSPCWPHWAGVLLIPKVQRHRHSDTRKSTHQRDLSSRAAGQPEPSPRGRASGTQDLDTDLFSSQNVSQPKSASLLPSKLPTSVSLFDDDDEEVCPVICKSVLDKGVARSKRPSPTPAFFSHPGCITCGLCFQDQWSITDTQTKPASDSKSTGELSDTRTSQGQWAMAMKKTSLFEEDDEDDLFAIAKDSQKKTQRVSLLFEDDVDNGSSLFGSPTTSTPPVAMKKETAHKALPLLFSDEEEKEPQFGVRPVAQKAESPCTPSYATSLEMSSSCSQSFAQGPDPDARPKSTGVFQDEELLFSHKLQKGNDPDVDLFAGTKNNRLAEPIMGTLFGDDEDEDLFSSAKIQPVVSAFSLYWGCERGNKGLSTTSAQEAIRPSDLFFPAAPLDKGTTGRTKTVLSLFDEEEDKMEDPESTHAPQTEVGKSPSPHVVFLVLQSHVKVRGKRRPQTHAARRLAAQVSSEAEDAGVPRGSITQLAEGATLPSGRQLQPRATSMEVKSEQAVAAATPPRESGPVPAMDRSPFVMALGLPRDETDLFDSEDIFSKGTRSQFTERAKAKVKDREISAHLAEGGKERSPLFPALGEMGSDDDLFQSVKPRSAKKTNPFPLLDDEDDLFTDQKSKKNEPKPSSQQEVVSKTQDIFEDDIFAIEAIATLFLFKDDIFSSGLQTKTTKPKSQSAQTTPEPKSKYKVSNIFDDPLNAFGGQ